MRIFKTPIRYMMPMDCLPNKAYDCVEFTDEFGNLISLESGKISNIDNYVVINQCENSLVVCDINYISIFETDIKKDYNGFRWISSNNRYGEIVHRYERIG